VTATATCPLPGARAMQPGEVYTAEAMRLSGMGYRRLSRLTRRGILRPAEPHQAQGDWCRWPPEEVVLMTAVVALDKTGIVVTATLADAIRDCLTDFAVISAGELTWATDATDVAAVLDGLDGAFVVLNIGRIRGGLAHLVDAS
jgi:hypothetical protein